MSVRVRKAIFPVGGLGTRFLPATKAMPKEMLPVVDKPLIQYAVEEAVAAMRAGRAGDGPVIVADFADAPGAGQEVVPPGSLLRLHLRKRLHRGTKTDVCHETAHYRCPPNA